MFCVSKISVLIAFGILLSYCNKHERRDGKLVLNPIELIDLITEEKLRTEFPSEDYKTNSHAKETINLVDIEEEMTTERECRDEETLRTRKVWSRWGKWGSCSVTCGAGAVTRTRACVAGRCARGEREEQRRPCVRAPCEDAHTLPDTD